MFLKRCFFINLLFGIIVALPPLIKPCFKPKRILNHCLQKHLPNLIIKLTTKGNENIGIPPLDPFILSDPIIYDIPIAVKTNFTLKNLQIVGLSNVDLKNVYFNMKNYKLRLRLRYPILNITLNYDIEGFLNGSGSIQISLKNIDVALKLSLDVLKYGKEFIKLPKTLRKGQDVFAMRIGDSQINFDGLIEDETLKKGFNQILNDYFLGLFNSSKEGVMLMFWDVLYSFIQPILDKTPVDLTTP